MLRRCRRFRAIQRAFRRPDAVSGAFGLRPNAKPPQNTQKAPTTVNALETVERRVKQDTTASGAYCIIALPAFKQSK
eukprot:13771895-Alexandrium_andersonii.AAC.1